MKRALGMPQSHRRLLRSPNIPSFPLCPWRGAMPSAGTPQPRGPGPPSHPPRPPPYISGALPGAFITPQQTTVSSQIPSWHAGSRATTAPGGEHGQVPATTPHDHRDPFTSTRLQQPDLGCSPRPATRRVAPCPGTVPPAPKTRGSPSLWDAGAAPGWLASPWGACRGTGWWDQSLAPAPNPKNGTSMGTRGTGLTSECPVPLLPLYQGCTQG